MAKSAVAKAKNKASHAAHMSKSSGAKGSAFKSTKNSTNPHRARAAGQTHLRTKATINRINMYRGKPDLAKMREAPKVPMVRIEPDRRWFGNTRVLSQEKLQIFREEMSKSVDDPFSVVLKASKLPMTLLKDSEKEGKMNLLQVESFNHTFGKKKLRTKPKLSFESLADMVDTAETKADTYDEGKADRQLVKEEEATMVSKEERTLVSEAIFRKGTSRRIWAELYKVIDSSDVVIQVIDARDPMGTRNMAFERELKKKWPHKKLVLLFNKCDLIPAWAAARWTKVLNKEYPTIAFHASITNPFGKSALMQLLRQFAMLLKNRMHVSIGLVGYPNVGKSSVINALKSKRVCKAAPVPGETKVWQYVALTKRLFLIDCPGITPPTADDFAADSAKVLRGVVRVEKVEFPSNYIVEVLDRVKPKYVKERYGLPKDMKWGDHDDFLSQLAMKMGKLRKGGEPDIEITARVMLMDWQRGRLPFFTMPPEVPEDPKEKAEAAEDEPKATRQAFKDMQCKLDFDDDDANMEEVDDEDADSEAMAEAALAADSDDEVVEDGDEVSAASDDVDDTPITQVKGKAKVAAARAAAEKKRAKKTVEKEDKKKKARRGGGKAKKVAEKEAAKPVSAQLDWGNIADEFAS